MTAIEIPAGFTRMTTAWPPLTLVRFWRPGLDKPFVAYPWNLDPDESMDRLWWAPTGIGLEQLP